MNLNSVDQLKVFKRLLRYLKVYKTQILIVIFTGVILSVTAGMQVNLLKAFGDGMQNSDKAGIWQASLLIFLVTLVGSTSRYFHIYLMNCVGEYVSQDLRSDLQKKFMKLNMTFYGQFKAGSGGLLTRILSDINMIQTGLRLVADFFREPLALLVLVFYLFYLNAKLTLSIIVLLPILFYLLKNLAKSVNKYSQKAQSSLDKIVSQIKESLDGVRVIQSFNLENKTAEKFRHQFLDYIDHRKKIYSRAELNGPVTELIASVLFVGVAITLHNDVLAGRLTWGDVTAYLGAMLLINKPIKALQDSYVRFQETLVSAGRIFAIFDETSEVKDLNINTKFPSNWNEIVFENVSFKYNEELVLKNVNLKIKKGEVVAFVGESGSGKSTMINLLERFYEPTHGQVKVDNLNISEISLLELRKNISLVTQDVFLFNDSVAENVRSGDFDKDPKGVKNALQAANAHEFVERSEDGYQTRMGERGALFSGGEKQRISIARAIFKDAPILILDEATSALDSISEQEVQAGIDQAIKGRTAIVIAHRFSTIKDVDRIYVFKNGEIVEQGQHIDLMSLNGYYSRLYQTQS